MKYLALALATATLAACNDGADPTPAPTAGASPRDTSTATSIMRPEITPAAETPQPLDALHVIIGFPDGGADLAPEEVTKLEALLASEQVKRGGAIRLAAHSDSKGSDVQNFAAARKRGETVRAWLIEKGISKDRIALVSFGEQNPLRPNGLPDGSPDEAGRAANRRVEITVGTDRAEPVEAREPTLAEELVEKSGPEGEAPSIRN